MRVIDEMQRQMESEEMQRQWTAGLATLENTRLSEEEITRRCNAVLASLEVNTHNQQVMQANQILKDSLHEALHTITTGRLSSSAKYVMMKVGLEYCRKKSKSLNLPSIVQQRIYVMLNILDPVAYPWEGQYTTKPTISTRNVILKQYMDDHRGPRDVNGLVSWLSEFYCKTYLGDCPKAKAILHFLDSNPPTAGTPVKNYLKQYQPGRNETLAQLIGGNRLSHLNRTPWGLKQVIKLFEYEKCSKDTTATQYTKTMFRA